MAALPANMAAHRSAQPYVPTYLQTPAPALGTPDPKRAQKAVTESFATYKEIVVNTPFRTARRVYSRSQLLSLRRQSVNLLLSDLVLLEPYGLVPRRFEALASTASAPSTSPRSRVAYEELLDGRSAAQLASDCTGSSTRDYWCPVCSAATSKDSTPCEYIRLLRQRLQSQLAEKVCTSNAIQCLLQPPEVFQNLLLLSLASEHKRGSARLRWMSEEHPTVLQRIRTFLCGEEDYVPLPAVTDHTAWKEMMELMGLDSVRDNRTRILTDLSKHWKRRTTPYEQFVFFYDFKNHSPPAPTKNIVTLSVKPGMVAMLRMDVVAMYLLHHHNFFIPEDHYWDVFRYLDTAVVERRLYNEVRHFGLFLSGTQRGLSLFSPIEQPALRL